MDLISKIETHIEQTRNLFLCRDIPLETYEAVRDRESAQIKTMREMGLDVTLPLTDSLKEKLSSWRSALPIDKKRQIRLMIETVWLQNNAIVALQPTLAFLPLFSQKQGSCNCGPDGLHSHSYNPILVIPPGLELDEAFAMVKKMQNVKENMPEESS